MSPLGAGLYAGPSQQFPPLLSSSTSMDTKLNDNYDDHNSMHVGAVYEASAAATIFITQSQWLDNVCFLDIQAFGPVGRLSSVTAASTLNNRLFVEQVVAACY
jgi:hypothetical protein